MIDLIPTFKNWQWLTPIIPDMYLGVLSHEQAILELCKGEEKLKAYLNEELTPKVNETANKINNYDTDFETFKNEIEEELKETNTTVAYNKTLADNANTKTNEALETFRVVTNNNFVERDTKQKLLNKKDLKCYASLQAVIDDLDFIKENELFGYYYCELNNALYNVSRETKTENNYTVIKLDDETFAELVILDKTLNIQELKWQAKFASREDITSLMNFIQKNLIEDLTKIIFPTGDFIFNNFFSCSNIEICGAGQTNTFIYNSTGAAQQEYFPMFVLAENCYFHDFGISSRNHSGLDMSGFYIVGDGVRLENIKIDSVSIGISLQQNGIIRNIIVKNIDMQSVGEISLQLVGDNSGIDNLLFENVYTTPVKVVGATVANFDISNIDKCVFKNCYFESRGGEDAEIACWKITSANVILFDNCTFVPNASNTTMTYRLYFDANVANLEFTNCLFDFKEESLDSLVNAYILKVDATKIQNGDKVIFNCCREINGWGQGKQLSDYTTPTVMFKTDTPLNIFEYVTIVGGTPFLENAAAYSRHENSPCLKRSNMIATLNNYDTNINVTSFLTQQVNPNGCLILDEKQNKIIYYDINGTQHTLAFA